MQIGNPIFSSGETTIFEIMSQLARQYQAVNLGQGFPDGEGPDDIREMAARALIEGPNQYPSMMGLPELRQALAAHNQRFYRFESDWERETLVTSGASEALAATILGLVQPGDEVIMFEPLFDIYWPLVKQAGGVPKVLRLSPPDWALPLDELAQAFGPKTRFVVINSPLNPCGKMLTPSEAKALSALLVQHDAYVICDEVYEHICFDGKQHIALIAMPELRERAIKIGSAGKTFSLTGWRVGYVTAAPSLLKPIAKAHQYLAFANPPALQKAIAYGLGKEEPYFRGLSQEMQELRDHLTAGLTRLSVPVLPCDGSYFLIADISAFDPAGDDRAFCQKLVKEFGLALIPISAFYRPESETGRPTPKQLVRFCFAKNKKLLDQAMEKLANALSMGSS